MIRLYCWLALASAIVAPLYGGPQAGGPAYDGQSVTCHFPTAEHLANKTGRDGLGLCVFTSLDHAARWANEPLLIGLRDHMTTQEGGGWPEKVDRVIHQRAQAGNTRWAGYLQHTGGDVEFLKKALRTGRYPCVTYAGSDGVFYRGPIHHMVNLAYLGERLAAIQDNNFPGRWLWLPTDAFLQRWRASGGGWAIVLLKAGPPPIPVNRAVIAATPILPLLNTAPPEAYAASDPPLNFGVLPRPLCKVGTIA
jgi:hypothetical protein